ncbi:MAG: hypothetical protein WBG80_06335 [Bacteroidota bacterium]
MQFDWITWSIWLVGFLILVVWIWVPYREFKRLIRTRAEARAAEDTGPDQGPSGSVNGGDD